MYYIEPIKLLDFEKRYSILREKLNNLPLKIETAQSVTFIRLKEENEVKKWYRVVKI